MCASKRQQLLRSGRHGGEKLPRDFVGNGAAARNKKKTRKSQTLPVPVSPPPPRTRHKRPLLKTEHLPERRVPQQVTPADTLAVNVGEGPKLSSALAPLSPAHRLPLQLSCLCTHPSSAQNSSLLLLKRIPSYSLGPSLNMMPSSTP